MFLRQSPRSADGVNSDNVERGEYAAQRTDALRPLGHSRDEPAETGECTRLYVGGSKEHSEYQRLWVQRQIAADQAWAAQEAQMDWGMWEPWW